MQPSEYEIQREVEALRDIRRRSTSQGGPGALIIDPDLPNQSPPPSPTSSYWSGTTPNATEEEPADCELEDGPCADLSPNDPDDDPFHLFWVPASLHPEIAPAEFRAFIKEHARAPVADGTGTLQRSTSNISTAPSQIGPVRKKSMLSRQYKPSENDDLESEKVLPVQRSKSIYGRHGPSLTISDLQKLEMLAEEASASDDHSKLRSILRRSLSLNISPSALDEKDEMPETGDEADSPIIVPPPGQILRRAARTKIRKSSLPGDGGGHRFGSSRRTTPRTSSGATTPSLQRNSLSSSSSEQGDSPEALRARTLSGESLDNEAVQSMIRPESYSEIYEAYATAGEEPENAPVAESPPSLTVELSPPIPLEPEPELELPVEPLSPPSIHHPQPQRYLVPPPTQEQPAFARTPSPEEPMSGLSLRSPVYDVPSTSPGQQRKDKDKKSLFGKWGGDKAAKRMSKEKDNRIEKESGFFGSLFGSKKKQDDHPSGHQAGREAAHALLGASKSSKNYVSPSSPLSAVGINNYSRYPIHVERAIYRLSHIKLANPRRPLYEQVLISNLMFWYLGVINKAQSPSSSPTPATDAGANTQTNSAEAEKEQKEREQREQREKEEQIRAEKEKKERERIEKEREAMEQKKKDPHRRGSLTKTLPPGNGGGGRRAEMPVRGPQYEMQHRVMEQEYNGYGGQPPGAGHGPPSMGRPSSAPPGPVPAQYQRIQQPVPPLEQQTPPSVQQQQPQQQQPQRLQPQPQPQSQPQSQPQAQPQAPNFFYGGAAQMGLPPGAMAPVPVEQAWISSPYPRAPMSPPQQPPEPTRPRRSRSPPPPHLVNSNRFQVPDLPGQGGANAAAPSRSVSATVQSSTHVNGKPRKATSAGNAGVPNGKRQRASDGGGEEEDMPLAIWQQQRRK